MVMEDTTYPSAQIVGREFVRQYYTLLNEGPRHLHRFYSARSSFVHGGVDRPGQEAQPVLGQQEIHKKILALNFNDCHAKIRQVDSQSTVGEAVVVQVTGELSNNGGPMRRFMQTFVLAPQNPQQYYVHNDIFRYQDEVFHDYESEEEAEVHNTDAGHENGICEDIVEFQPEHEIPVVQKAEVVQPTSSPPPALLTQHQVDEKPVVASNQTTESVVEKNEMKPEQPKVEETKLPEKIESVESDDLNSSSTTKETPAEPTPPKNFSWANVVNSKNSGPNYGNTNSATVAIVNPMTPSSTNNGTTALPLSVISTQQQMEESVISVPEEKPNNFPPAARSNRSSAEPIPRRPPRNEEGYGERRNERYPDSQQVFVGNLPHDIAELELRKFFTKYGKVIECRINRSGNGNKVPFGFVVFDNEGPVQQLLSIKRVEMNGHRLNVEEKKARFERTASGGRDHKPRVSRQNRNSRPKDRENSGSRPDKQQGKGGYGGPQRQMH